MDEKAGVVDAKSRPGQWDAGGPKRVVRPGEGFIYAIGCADANAVKIGYSVKAGLRMASLQGGNPFELILLASGYTKTPFSDEQRLHVHLEASRIRGEWFRCDPPVMHVVDVIKQSNHRRFIDELVLDIRPMIKEPRYRRPAGAPPLDFSWTERYPRRRKSR